MELEEVGEQTANLGYGHYGHGHGHQSRRMRRLVRRVRQLAERNDVTPIPEAPEVSDEMFELGQALMFDKELSGNRDISCMTCHFNTLNTDDDRHLSAGVNGLGLGEERVGGRIHSRNALPLFNLHALDRLFWDGRIETQAAHDADGRTEGTGDQTALTPAGAEFTQDMRDVMDFGLVSTLPLFPVLERAEMRGQRFTNGPYDNELAGDIERTEIWARLMARLAAIPEYVTLFEAAYPGTDFDDMTFAHASNAMGAFQIRAFTFRDSPFERLLRGDDHAMSYDQLKGAEIFFEEGCANCHNGPMLSDQSPHNTGLAQFGTGAGDGKYDNDDFGRAAVIEGSVFHRGQTTGASIRDRYSLDDSPEVGPHMGPPGSNPDQLFAFRTAPLHNVTLTAPYGHAGQFPSLRDFVNHYDDPATNLENYDIADHVLPNERFLTLLRVDNPDDIIPRIDPDADVAVSNVDRVVAFLGSLTDPAAEDLSDTIPTSVPSGLPLFEEAPPNAGAVEGTVSFTNVAAEVGMGDYNRAPSERAGVANFFQQNSLTTPMVFLPDIIPTPLRWRGIPGVAIYDYDNDGDEDVFATNGPGAPNSLYQNQLAQTGQLTFIDVAAAAGVEGADTDNSGVCYGDIDNDGDHDMFVVADKGRSHMYRNNGDGTFEDVSDLSGTNLDGTGGNSCALGDINGDGLVDLAIARGWHEETVEACFFNPFGAGIQHNELWVNNGGFEFENVTATSGILNIWGVPPGAPTITWTVALVDYDQDGDVDLFTADDQCAMPPAAIGGVDRGFLQVFDNDGTGHFTNRTGEAGTNYPSAWMGLSFGDFNSDGHLDFFSTSFGDWARPFAGAPELPGNDTSRWLLGAPGKTFTAPGIGQVGKAPFAWGTSARDFDNDGDTDLTFHGGLDLWFHVDKSNPGTMLLNDGNANFGLDIPAFGGTHARRNDSGVAAGDINQDGYQDIITVSNFDIPAPMPIGQHGAFDFETQFFTPFDPWSHFSPTFELVEEGAESPVFKIERRMRWNDDIVYPNGTIAMELNSGGNGNGSAQIRYVGAVGLVTGAVVNRDGLGAMTYFTPRNGNTVMAPVLGGSSHVSQDSLYQHYGLGHEHRGTAEVLWPGGVRNRLYNVRAGEVLTVPELPCSYDTDDGFISYATCVYGSINELRDEGLVDRQLARRMRRSAIRAYLESH